MRHIPHFFVAHGYRRDVSNVIRAQLWKFLLHPDAELRRGSTLVGTTTAGNMGDDEDMTED